VQEAAQSPVQSKADSADVQQPWQDDAGYEAQPQDEPKTEWLQDSTAFTGVAGPTWLTMPEEDEPEEESGIQTKIAGVLRSFSRI